MVSGKIIIKNKLGIHLRPATLLSKTGIEFDSTISLRMGTITVSAKSVLGLLGACVRHNDEIEIICDGPDEKEALETMLQLIEEGMGDNLDED